MLVLMYSRRNGCCCCPVVNSKWMLSQRKRDTIVSHQNSRGGCTSTYIYLFRLQT